MAKIPGKAKLVFSGRLFDTYQWEQEMFDGSTSTFEMLKRPDVAVGICILDGKIVLLKENQPGAEERIAMPGGRVEFGETPEQAFKREVREEVGRSTVDIYKLQELAPDSKIDFTIHTFIAKLGKSVGEENPDRKGERISLLTVTFDEFIDLIKSEQMSLVNTELWFAVKMLMNGEEDKLKALLFGE